MNQQKPAVSVLWTGGKDSALALHQIEAQGYTVRSLVTFAPPNPQFLAHPIPIIRLQAKALDLPHHLIEIHTPYQEGYENAITSLEKEHRIDALVTGDIAEVDGQPNWIRECSRSAGVEVLTPLWGCDRAATLRTLLDRRFKVIFSCVKKPWFTGAWIGRELNEASFADLVALNKATGMDICGENGEYHTLVLDGPLFEHEIAIEAFSCCEQETLFHLGLQAFGTAPPPAELQRAKEV